MFVFGLSLAGFVKEGVEKEKTGCRRGRLHPFFTSQQLYYSAKKEKSQAPSVATDVLNPVRMLQYEYTIFYQYVTPYPLCVFVLTGYRTFAVCVADSADYLFRWCRGEAPTAWYGHGTRRESIILYASHYFIPAPGAP
jgi:hypothetical protein